MRIRCQHQNISPWQAYIRADVTHDTATQLASVNIPPSYTPAGSVFGLAVWGSLVGNTQTLDPLERQLAPTKWCSLLLQNAHTHILSLDSEKGKTHQPRLQPSEIIAVVKIWLSSERRFSQHFHTVHEVTCTRMRLSISLTHMNKCIHMQSHT